MASGDTVFNSTEEILEDIRQGKMVVLMDDEDRENDGDLIMAASMVRPEDINAPQFFRINVEARSIEVTRADGARRSTTIERTEQVDGKLILQGAEDGIEDVRDGLGWTITIGEDTGKIVLSAAGDDVAFVIFGACTRP